MKHLMLDHAFRSVEHVVFHIGVDNVRSQRSVEKLGATLLPERRMNAEGRESVAYEISRS
jgi:N-acetyltransferase